MYQKHEMRVLIVAMNQLKQPTLLNDLSQNTHIGFLISSNYKFFHLTSCTI